MRNSKISGTKMRATTHHNTNCPGCGYYMEREERGIYCNYPQCEFFNQIWEFPTIEIIHTGLTREESKEE